MSNKYSEEVIIRVWSMAKVVPGYDPSYVRMDICGAFIQYQDYGDRNSRFGWEIDHKHPLSLGGTDTWNNVQPLHWENNSSKGSGRLLCTTNSSNQ
jgi:hypothetical protein